MVCKEILRCKTIRQLAQGSKIKDLWIWKPAAAYGMYGIFKVDFFFITNSLLLFFKWRELVIKNGVTVTGLCEYSASVLFRGERA